MSELRLWWFFNELRQPHTYKKAQKKGLKHDSKSSLKKCVRLLSQGNKLHLCLFVNLTTFCCFSFLQEVVHLMRASLSVTTNKILTMTLTGRTSTPRNCHMSHHICHKVKLKFLSPHVCHLLLHHLKVWKAAYCLMQFEVLELFFEFHHFLDVISSYYCSTFIMQDYYCSAISQLYPSTSDNHIVYMLNYEQRFATFGCCFFLVAFP